MTTGVIIQARLGSKRFPRKVLADLNGKTVLQHVIERCRKITADIVVLAIPEGDTELADLGRGLGVSIYEGPENDVLSRYCEASRSYDIDLIMRITADCPLIDPKLCSSVIDLYNVGNCDYAAIDWPHGGYPKGYGCEVFSRPTLTEAYNKAADPYDREHVTPWMQRNVSCKYLQTTKDESHLNYCVDTPEDLERLRNMDLTLV